MGFKLFTMDEAAREARICVRNLEKKIAASRGPAVTTLGRRRFIRSDMLASWIEANTSAPAPVAQAA